jgi:G:T-mismatch repair DNA endonuclease (very short patch repair protein)
MYKCFCNSTFKTKRALSIHLAQGEKLNGLNKEETLVFIVYGKKLVQDFIEQYKAETLCVNDIKKLGYDLGKYFFLLGIKRSNQEEKLTKRYLNKYENSCLTKHGVKNVSQLKEVKDKKINTHLKNYGTNNNFNDSIIQKNAYARRTEKMQDSNHKRKYLEKYIRTCQDKYGTDNVSKYKPIAKKISNTHKEKCSLLTLEEKRKMTEAARAFWSTQISWESKAEIKIHYILDNLNIKYQKHQNMYGYNYDIVINDYIIEINGDFWHGNPLFYKSEDILLGNLKASDVWTKDDRKKKIAIDNGNKYLVIWECDIISSTDTELTHLIKDFLG